MGLSFSDNRPLVLMVGFEGGRFEVSLLDWRWPARVIEDRSIQYECGPFCLIKYLEDE